MREGVRENLERHRSCENESRRDHENRVREE